MKERWLDDVIVIDAMGKEIIERVPVGGNEIAVPTRILSPGLGLVVYGVLNREY